MCREGVIAALTCLVCLGGWGQTPVQVPSPVFEDRSESGDTREPWLASCPAANEGALAGPYLGYGHYCYYLGQAGMTCDAVCSGLGGTNLAAHVDSLWPERCEQPPGPEDVSTWFYVNANFGGWTGPGIVSYFRSIGYGHTGDEYYGKCSYANMSLGAYPGETETLPDVVLVCACFQVSVIFQDGFESGGTGAWTSGKR